MQSQQLLVPFPSRVSWEPRCYPNFAQWFLGRPGAPRQGPPARRKANGRGAQAFPMKLRTCWEGPTREWGLGRTRRTRLARQHGRAPAANAPFLRLAQQFNRGGVGIRSLGWRCVQRGRRRERCLRQAPAGGQCAQAAAARAAASWLVRCGTSAAAKRCQGGKEGAAAHGPTRAGRGSSANERKGRPLQKEATPRPSPATVSACNRACPRRGGYCLRVRDGADTGAKFPRPQCVCSRARRRCPLVG